MFYRSPQWIKCRIFTIFAMNSGGDASLLLFLKVFMIDKTALRSFLETRLAGTGYFLVDLSISASNEIKVEIDSADGVDIDYCIALSRAIEESFPANRRTTSWRSVRPDLPPHSRSADSMRKTSATKWKSLRLTARNTAAHSEVTDNGFTVEIRTRVRREGGEEAGGSDRREAVRLRRRQVREIYLRVLSRRSGQRLTETLNT